MSYRLWHELSALRENPCAKYGFVVDDAFAACEHRCRRRFKAGLHGCEMSCKMRAQFRFEGKGVGTVDAKVQLRHPLGKGLLNCAESFVELASQSKRRTSVRRFGFSEDNLTAVEHGKFSVGLSLVPTCKVCPRLSGSGSILACARQDCLI